MTLTTTLPPMAWSAFSAAAPLSRAETLDRVNRLVNAAIAPRYEPVSAMDAWQIAPQSGWCHDYAVTKRWLLLGLGFTASELLLCECIAPDGEHHLVLLVDGLALDNLTNDLRPMHYRVVRRQSSTSPDQWQTA